MQATSELYKEIFSGEHSKEIRLAVGEKDTALGNLSTSYGIDALISMSTSAQLFSEDTPMGGSCVAREIFVKMLYPATAIPRQAKLVPQVRITDGSRYSEWISKGVFFVDTREQGGEGNFKTLSLNGYDAILIAEQNYPASTHEWPAKDIDVVREIAAFIGVEIDARTIDIMTNGYLVQYPGEYTCREVLGYIAAMYAGCFIMSDIGELRLVTLNGIPAETRYLIDRSGDAVTFGGDRILV